MMQRIVLFFSMMMLLVTTLAAQDAAVQYLIEEGNMYYQEEQFNAAIPFFREVADQDRTNASVNYKLAECYRKTFNYAEAEAYYLKSYYLNAQEYPLSLYFYALMLKLNANFEESVVQFDAFIREHEQDGSMKEYVEQAVVDREGSVMAKTQYSQARNAAQCTPMPTLINTTFNDYAPAVRDSTTLAITSGRVVSNRKLIDERFGEAFSDNYYFQKSGSAWQDKTKQNFDIVNSRYNDGSGCFSSDGNKFYFTVCGRDGAQCRIYISEFKGDRWSEPSVLNSNINFKTYESKQPAISHGGDTLLFVSNRPGGFGQYDIWMSIDAGEEQWGPAVNMGNTINTKLNELAPSLTSFQNVLFFASDGHEGYGGLDLYMSKKLSTGETIIYNLDFPFNSNRDDCFMTFSDRQLYFSSNRHEGMGGFDIYSSNIQSVISFISKVSLKNLDARRNIKLKSKTDNRSRLELVASRNEEKIEYENLSYEKKKLVDKLVNGRIHNAIPDADDLHISVEEFNTLEAISQVRYDEYRMQQKFNNSIVTKVPLPTVRGEGLYIEGMLTDSLTNEQLTSVTLMLSDELGEILKTTRTNENGQFRFTDVPSDKILYIRLQDQHVNSSRPLLTKLNVAYSVDHNVVYPENIYFDFDHYTLRPEATKVLDALSTYLMQNTGVQVEIFAFADDRGSDDYNFRLTQKRGQSVVNYLLRKGVDQTGLAIISKGKQNYSGDVNEVGRQYSRRVEFYLNGVKTEIKETVKTYILKKEITWSALSQLTGVSKSNLLEFNNQHEEIVHAFQPVRIPLQAKSISSELFFIGI